jgi:hypothetical protein
MQIKPTQTWCEGDSVQKTLLKRKYDGWVWGIPYRETFDMESLLQELLDSIDPYKERLAEVARRFSLKKEISFGVYIGGETPTAWFSADTLRRLSELGVDLDVDLILIE